MRSPGQAASLRTFEDVAADYATRRLAPFQARRGGRRGESVPLDIACRRRDARVPQGRNKVGYVEALRRFKTAKTLAPTYRNLDRLIDEATNSATESY